MHASICLHLRFLEMWRRSQERNNLSYPFTFPNIAKAGVAKRHISEGLFVSHQRRQASRDMGWPLGRSGELPGKSGELPGSRGKLPGTSGLLLKSIVREVPGKSPRNFLESSGKFWEVQGLSRTSGELNSLPALSVANSHATLCT